MFIYYQYNDKDKMLIHECNLTLTGFRKPTDRDKRSRASSSKVHREEEPRPADSL